MTMTVELVIHSVSATGALLLGVLAVVRKWNAVASWCFLAGMAVLAVDATLGMRVLEASTPEGQASGLRWQWLAKSLLPGSWLCFSLLYCRGNAREFLWRWIAVLVLVALAPPVVAAGWRSELVLLAPVEGFDNVVLVRFGPPAKLVNTILLVAYILVLGNLEKTFRASVGTVRWRIKYLYLGVGLILGVRVYTLSQALLFSSFNPVMTTLEALALLVGCGLMAVAYVRKGFGDLDIYPSRTILQGSITVVLVGGYLLVVGVLAQVVAALGTPEGFPAQSFVILTGVAGLAILLLSDRFRSGVQRMITRHFRRPEHDSRAIWTDFTRRTSGVMDRETLCRISSELISTSFEVLTIRVLLLDDDDQRLTLAVSTYDGKSAALDHESGVAVTAEMRDGLLRIGQPFELESLRKEWGTELRKACPSQFAHGGCRLGLSLRAAGRLLGVLVLADRVKGMSFSHEERDLLCCLGDQLAAGLLNLRLTAEQMRSREMEAFQTMSTFFVHDLKNAANSLGLMLQNAPAHFDDPEFRKDALRAVRRTVDRINHLVFHLGTLRATLQPELSPCDLNQLVDETLNGLKELSEKHEVVRDLRPLPTIRVDQNLIRSVLTNLVVNASEALGENGWIRVTTTARDGGVLIEVADNGKGMSREFVRSSLFRPFCSTKSKGMGIGMFQSKAIVEAHRGVMEVESEPGAGTRFRIALPAAGPDAPGPAKDPQT